MNKKNILEYADSAAEFQCNKKNSSNLSRLITVAPIIHHTPNTAYNTSGGGEVVLTLQWREEET